MNGIQQLRVGQSDVERVKQRPVGVARGARFASTADRFMPHGRCLSTWLCVGVGSAEANGLAGSVSQVYVRGGRAAAGGQRRPLRDGLHEGEALGPRAARGAGAERDSEGLSRRGFC